MGGDYEIDTLEQGADLFIDGTRDFYHVVVTDTAFNTLAQTLVNSKVDLWDSSVLKVVDNLVCNIQQYLKIGCASRCSDVTRIVLGVHAVGGK